MEAKRITVTLDEPEQAVLSAFADPKRAEHAALEAWADERGMRLKSSEAGMIRALIQAGAESLRERALEQAYEQIAVARRADADHEAERAARRARRAERDRVAPA